MADIWLYFIPLYIVGGVLVLLILFGLLARIRGGRLVRPIATWLGKAPVIGRMLQRASRAALERQNPELASAIRKLERAGAGRDPERAQKAVSQLSAEERRAWLAAAEEQQAFPQPMNRAQRRQQEKLRKRRPS
jgi:hypothetical protein